MILFIFLTLVLSPGHILQVDVYRGATLLPLVTGPAHHLSDLSGGVSVDQSILDVELWLNGVLQAQLEKVQLHYRSLMDYDIQLYQVHTCTCTGGSVWCSSTVRLLSTQT